MPFYIRILLVVCLAVGYVLPQIYLFSQCVKDVLFSIAALKQIDALTIELSQFELDKVLETQLLNLVLLLASYL